MDTTTQEVEKKQATQAEAETSEQETADSGNQELNWTPEQKAYIESLRKENAKYRTKSKELEANYSGLNDRFSKMEKGLKSLFGSDEDDDTPPEAKIEALSSHNETLLLNNALTEAALEYGIGKEDFSYFKFLVTEKLQGLGEGEELTEEDLELIAKQSRKSKTASTSVDNGGPAPQVEGGITLEQFSKMGINERSKLFSQNETLYKQLLDQERSAKAK